MAGGATLLLLSDGHANIGVTERRRLGGRGRASAPARRDDVDGRVGLGYDETLLAAIARGGQGTHAFAEDGDAPRAVVAGEVTGLLSKTVQAATLIIRPKASVQTVTIWNDLPSQPVERGVMIELGDLWAGEARKLLLSFAVPAMRGSAWRRSRPRSCATWPCPSSPRRRSRCRCTSTWCRATRPRAAYATRRSRASCSSSRRRTPSAAPPTRSTGATRRSALAAYGAAGEAIAAAPAAGSAELREEAANIAELARRVTAGDTVWSAKRGRAEHARKSRKRGREG